MAGGGRWPAPGRARAWTCSSRAGPRTAPGGLSWRSEDVELLGLRAGGEEQAAAADAGAGAAPTALATLRVGARQAVYLTAAANLAGEVRLLVRPPGDRRRVGEPPS